MLSNEQALMVACQSDRLNWSLIPTNTKLKYTCVLQPFAVGSIWSCGGMDARSRSRSPTGLDEWIAIINALEEGAKEGKKEEEMEEGAKEEGWGEDCGKKRTQWWWSYDTWWVQWEGDWWAWNWVNAEWLSWSAWTRYY